MADFWCHFYSTFGYSLTLSNRLSLSLHTSCLYFFHKHLMCFFDCLSYSVNMHACVWRFLSILLCKRFSSTVFFNSFQKITQNTHIQRQKDERYIPIAYAVHFCKHTTNTYTHTTLSVNSVYVSTVFCTFCKEISLIVVTFIVRNFVQIRKFACVSVSVCLCDKELVSEWTSVYSTFALW